MISYCLGFLFSPDRKFVALIKKTKPAWQLGRLNGIGGKVELLEGYFDAMIREFREETGAEVTDWEFILKMGRKNPGSSVEWAINVYRSFSDKIFNLKTTTEEEVIVAEVDLVLRGEYPTIPNLKWLIPMVLDGEHKGGFIRY